MCIPPARREIQSSELEVTPDGAVDLNATLSESGDADAPVTEASQLAGASGAQTEGSSPAVAPAARHHRLDENQLSGFGRLAAEPRTQTSRKGDDYTILRVAQNVRLVGARIVTNYFDLVCFGGMHEIAKRLTTGQEVYFRGTFGQESLERPGHPPRLLNKVIVDYLRPVTRLRVTASGTEG